MNQGRAVRRSGSGALARAAAAEAVDQVLTAGRSVESALLNDHTRKLAERDKAFVKALTYGTLRWHHRHAVILEKILDRPLRARDRVLDALLSVGLFQLINGRQPGYASVSATVDAARRLRRPRAANLINATLRRFAREQDAILSEALATEQGRFSHPPWLIELLRRDWGDRAQQIMTFSLVQAPMWLRLNPAKCSLRQFTAEMLARHDLQVVPLPGIPTAVYPHEALPVDRIPGFDAGQVSVQDAGAQLAAELLDAAPGMRVLDACAAPGGKTGHVLERVDGQLDLVAIDIDARRNERVRDNLARLGYTAQILTADSQAIDDWTPMLAGAAEFDRVLVDAPCSGTGVIRRHPDIKFLRRPDDIPAFAARQAQMLDALWMRLKAGGRLLYSTCSVLRAENHDVVADFLSRHRDAREIPAADLNLPDFVVSAPGPGIQLLPGNENTDGFYYALIERSA